MKRLILACVLGLATPLMAVAEDCKPAVRASIEWRLACKCRTYAKACEKAEELKDCEYETRIKRCGDYWCVYYQ